MNIKKKIYLKKWRLLNKQHILEYRQKNKKKIKRQVKEWEKRNPNYYRDWSRKNKTKVLLRNKKWRDNNKEKVHQITLNNKKRNKKRFKEYNSEWSKKNPNKIAIYNNKRRCYLINGNFIEEEWEKIKKKYNYICQICKKQEPEIKLTIDHIIPLSKGGLNIKENIQPLCKSCNSSKKDKILNK